MAQKNPKKDNLNVNLLKERKGPSQNIAFASIIIAAISSFSLLAEFLPLSAIFIVLFIPPLSALAVEYCERRYAWLFLCGALLLSFVVTVNNCIETIFYVFPGIISGFFYGYMRKSSLPLLLNIFLSALLSMGLNYLSLPLIEAIFEINMIHFALSLLNLQEVTNIHYVVPLFIYALSLFEMAISHLLIELLNSRLGYQKEKETKESAFYPLLSFLFGCLSIAMGFIHPPLGYLFLSFCSYFALCGNFSFFSKAKTVHFVFFFLFFIAAIFLFALFYKSMPSGSGLLLLSLIFVGNDFVTLPIGLQLLSIRKKDEKRGQKH